MSLKGTPARKRHFAAILRSARGDSARCCNDTCSCTSVPTSDWLLQQYTVFIRARLWFISMKSLFWDNDDRFKPVARNWGEVIIQVTRGLQLHVAACRSLFYRLLRLYTGRADLAARARAPRLPGRLAPPAGAARGAGGRRLPKCHRDTLPPGCAAGAVILCFTVHRTSILDPPGMYLCVYLDSS